MCERRRKDAILSFASGSKVPWASSLQRQTEKTGRDQNAMQRKTGTATLVVSSTLFTSPYNIASQKNSVSCSFPSKALVKINNLVRLKMVFLQPRMLPLVGVAGRGLSVNLSSINKSFLPCLSALCLFPSLGSIEVSC